MLLDIVRGAVLKKSVEDTDVREEARQFFEKCISIFSTHTKLALITERVDASD